MSLRARSPKATFAPAGERMRIIAFQWLGRPPERREVCKSQARLPSPASEGHR